MIKEGDLDKISKVFQQFIKTRTTSSLSQADPYVKKTDVKNGIEKAIKLEVYYPSWKLIVSMVDEEESVDFHR